MIFFLIDPSSNRSQLIKRVYTIRGYSTYNPGLPFHFLCRFFLSCPTFLVLLMLWARKMSLSTFLGGRDQRVCVCSSPLHRHCSGSAAFECLATARILATAGELRARGGEVRASIRVGEMVLGYRPSRASTRVLGYRLQP